ncbi:MAG: DUF885 family protein [Xanthomonadales bacterium]|nr:DUF885 family protein [Xanthomonadales bacterium]
MNKLFHGLLFLMTWLSTAIGDSKGEMPETVKWEALIDEMAALEVTAPQLDFAVLLQQNHDSKSLLQRSNQLKRAQTLVHNFSATNHCQNLKLEVFNHVITAEKLRIQLAQQQLTHRQQYQGSIAQLELGKSWYRYLSMLWLGEAINPDELYQIGFNDFQKAIGQYRDLKEKIEQNQLLRSFLSSDEDAVIQQKYKDIEHQVLRFLETQFTAQGDWTALNIARSLQGADFPAPGYYDSSNQTMYYHPLSERYDVSQMEWLYLHEGIPGHHFQSQVNAQSTMCHQLQADGALSYGRMAFVEGWAAYVETLGVELGLLKKPHSRLYALKWEALRAMRVMIDVGIHAKAWSDKTARQHWLQLFPEGEDVMEREINRIKRWPMQVNSYVYGKHRIEQLKLHLKAKEGDAFDVRLYHQNLLKISHLPIHVLSQYEQLFKSKESSS